MTKYFDLPIKGQFNKKKDTFTTTSKWDDSYAFTTNDTAGETVIIDYNGAVGVSISAGNIVSQQNTNAFGVVKNSVISTYTTITLAKVVGNFSTTDATAFHATSKNFGDGAAIKSSNPPAGINQNFNTFNSILIKGKYMGYGGVITFKPEKHIINNPNGFKIINKLSDSDSTKFIIDLKRTDMNIIDSSKNDDSTIVQNNNLAYNNNIPSSVLLSNYSLIESFANNLKIGKNGTIYKKKKDGSISLEGNNYVNMCITNISTIDNTSNKNTENIFAKILLPNNKNSILYNTFVPSIKTYYEAPLRSLDELDIKFLDNENNAVEFNNKEHSFTLEITELEDKLEYLNTKTGTLEY